jgi:hypothetical protein
VKLIARLEMYTSHFELFEKKFKYRIFELET